MNEQKTHQLKNLVIIMTGIIVSLASIVYIVIQYSKLLTALFMKNDITEEEGGKVDAKLRSSLRQVDDGEGTPPDTLDEEDITFEITEEE